MAEFHLDWRSATLPNSFQHDKHIQKEVYFKLHRNAFYMLYKTIFIR